MKRKSWKPSRSSGILFDTYNNKSEKNRIEVIKMIKDRSYLSFNNLNKFSKHIYLSWLNYEKAQKTFNKNFECSIIQFAIHEHIYKMLLKYPEKIYKPFAEKIKIENNFSITKEI